MKTKTWAKCEGCDKVVRVRRDNGCLWVHSERHGDRFYTRCPGSGFKSTASYRRRTPRNPKLRCFVAQRGWPPGDDLSEEQKVLIVQDWLGYSDEERQRIREGGMP